MSKEFICPIPKVWNEIHQKLVKAVESEKNAQLPKPPTPLILNGWIFSSDKEKSLRWKETINWAKQYGFESLILKLEPDEIYFGNPEDTFNSGDHWVSEVLKEYER
ncbi:MAG TPA: hypothetical protein PKE69_21375 [Pyrinomonadaceae bacterium]|nr:hypothetical protein [Pyrinomonadaceae bacterium]